jgi:hypothetical protein
MMLAMIRRGTTPAAAARAVGIPASSFHRWMQQGEDQHASAHLRLFRESVERAQASWAVHLSEIVFRAAVRSPALALRLLHALDPDEPAWKG